MALAHLAGEVLMRCKLTGDVAIDVCMCQSIEERRGMVSWVDERCGMEKRHRWRGRGRVDGGRNRYGWAFKRHPCGGGPDARSAIGTP